MNTEFDVTEPSAVPSIVSSSRSNSISVQPNVYCQFTPPDATRLYSRAAGVLARAQHCSDAAAVASHPHAANCRKTRRHPQDRKYMTSGGVNWLLHDALNAQFHARTMCSSQTRKWYIAYFTLGTPFTSHRLVLEPAVVQVRSKPILRSRGVSPRTTF